MLFCTNIFQAPWSHCSRSMKQHLSSFMKQLFKIHKANCSRYMKQHLSRYMKKLFKIHKLKPSLSKKRALRCSTRLSFHKKRSSKTATTPKRAAKKQFKRKEKSCQSFSRECQAMAAQHSTTSCTLEWILVTTAVIKTIVDRREILLLDSTPKCKRVIWDRLQIVLLRLLIAAAP